VNEDYVAALQAGARLMVGRSRIARRIAELTTAAGAGRGKEPAHQRMTYFFEALRPQGRIVGCLMRATGPMAASRTREWEFDPGIEAIASPYTMAAMAYFGEQLGMSSELRYEVLAMDVHKGWDWNRGEAKGNSFATTSRDLSRALRRNPHLKVFVGSGRYDLGTPYSATDWSLAQLDAPADVLTRVQHHYYDAGHMMYTREEDMTQLKADVAAWLGT
jgi:carboxypeptidase C (cathepsin A)